MNDVEKFIEFSICMDNEIERNLVHQESSYDQVGYSSVFDDVTYYPN